MLGVIVDAFHVANANVVSSNLIEVLPFELIKRHMSYGRRDALVAPIAVVTHSALPKRGPAGLKSG
jgi:hypothetical protein